MSTHAKSEQGPVSLHMMIGEAGGEWQIDSVWWRYADPATLPRD